MGMTELTDEMLEKFVWLAGGESAVLPGHELGALLDALTAERRARVAAEERMRELDTRLESVASHHQAMLRSISSAIAQLEATRLIAGVAFPSPAVDVEAWCCMCGETIPDSEPPHYCETCKAALTPPTAPEQE